jgi:hypothetical protein
MKKLLITTTDDLIVIVVAGFAFGVVSFSNLLDFNFLNYLTNFDTTLAAIIAGWIAVKNFRFQALHAKRLIIIEHIYEKLVATHDAFIEVIKPLRVDIPTKEDNDEQMGALLTTANDFSQYYRSKEIFLAPAIANQLHKIRTLYQQLLVRWEL